MVVAIEALGVNRENPNRRNGRILRFPKPGVSTTYTSPALKDRPYATILLLRVQGFPYREIGAKLGLTTNTARTYGSRTLGMLGAESTWQALFKAEESGIIHPGDLAKHIPVDPATLASLTGTERSVLEVMVSDSGANGTDRGIGEKLGKTRRTVKQHITSILAKTGASNRWQVGLAYYAQKKHARKESPTSSVARPDGYTMYERPVRRLSPRQKEFLYLTAQGLPDQEVADRMNMSLGSLRNARARLHRNFRVESDFQLIVQAAGQQEVTLQEFVQSDLSTFAAIGESQQRVLDALVEGMGKNTTQGQIAKALGMTENGLYFHLKKICHHLQIPYGNENKNPVLTRLAVMTQAAKEAGILPDHEKEMEFQREIAELVRPKTPQEQMLRKLQELAVREAAAMNIRIEDLAEMLEYQEGRRALMAIRAVAYGNHQLYDEGALKYSREELDDAYFISNYALSKHPEKTIYDLLVRAIAHVRNNPDFGKNPKTPQAKKQ